MCISITDEAFSHGRMPGPTPGNSDLLGPGRVLGNCIFKNSIDASYVKY